MKDKIWQIKVQDNDEASALAADLGISTTTARILLNRGYDDTQRARDFITGDKPVFHDGLLMADMEKAIDRIISAVERKEKVTIYGDYDVDGVTATSMLYKYLVSLGLETDYYIPCRFEEGYGINSDALRQIHNTGTTLLITVDTGITALEEAQLAKLIGLDIIITDHHDCRDHLPEVVAVVNPKRPNCMYPFKELAGVGVIFKLICAMEAQKKSNCAFNDYVELAAIGTIADVMPLSDENRYIVKAGLSLMENSRYPGIRALIKVAVQNNTKRKINSTTVSYGMAPKINAAGRIADAGRAVELFLSEDDKSAEMIAKELCEINRQRQIEENVILEQALEMIRSRGGEDKALVLDHEGWHHGIIGIVASRLTDRFHMPAILLSFENEIGKGSARSVKGLNIMELFESCSDLLITYGGHELAAGLSIKKENLDAFRNAVNSFVSKKLGKITPPAIDVDCEIPPSQITMEVAGELSSLEPFGQANPIPVLAMSGGIISEITPLSGDKHIRFTLSKDGMSFKAIFFSVSIKEFPFADGDETDAVFNLDINDFMSNRSIQLIIKDIRPSSRLKLTRMTQQKLYNRVRSRDDLSFDEKFVPKSEDFKAVYAYLRQEAQSSAAALPIHHHAMKIANSTGLYMDYVKLRLILDIFDEMKLLEMELSEDILKQLKLVNNSVKINLDNSVLLQKLKLICTNND